MSECCVMALDKLDCKWVVVTVVFLRNCDNFNLLLRILVKSVLTSSDVMRSPAICFCWNVLCDLLCYICTDSDAVLSVFWMDNYNEMKRFSGFAYFPVGNRSLLLNSYVLLIRFVVIDAQDATIFWNHIIRYCVVWISVTKTYKCLCWWAYL